MSVSVQHLSKHFGAQKAVDSVSFEAKKGQVLGFLGPNGAGKSTTMKMLTCFLPPTSGEAKVCGLDVVTNSEQVRELIGYLPEHNPVYKDMYVKEYLEFTGRVHGVANLKSRIAKMIEQTGLGLEQHKQIKDLSKGYRQRVGLAQAMLHDPQVLILDEPTSGLDPNQLVDIRALIKELGKEKTVILSTHIMQEVQALCDHVVIINAGKIAANAPISQLQSTLSDRIVLTVEFAAGVKETALTQIAHVTGVRHLGGQRWELSSAGDQDIRKDVFQFAVAQNVPLLEMRKEVLSMEHIFQTLTKKGA
jgi:ABC-2 type transport system ATP-binding protein